MRFCWVYVFAKGIVEKMLQLDSGLKEKRRFDAPFCFANIDD